MKNILKYYWLIVFVPFVAKAWTPGQSIVPCGTSTTGPCDLNGLIQLVNNVLDVFIWLAVPISTVVVAVIGWDLIVSGDKTQARSGAKKKFESMIKGIVLILAAWVIVKTIVSALVRPEFQSQLLGLI